MRIHTPWKLLLGTLLLGSCTKNEVLPDEWYACTLDAEGSQPEMHPKNEEYQRILDTHRPYGLVGAQLCIWDENGLWTGGDGWSDVASAVPVTPCQPFLIASISKVFTAAAAYRLADQGMLDVESPVSSLLDAETLDNIANAGDVSISDLLSHRSGIPDFYTLAFELARINRLEQGWSKEDVLDFVRGRPATHEAGSSYHYSNTNYLLLSMVLETVTGKSLEDIYHQEVFTPLELGSAHYSEQHPIPQGCAKGYVDIYGSGDFVESEFLYRDELGIGGDGGIAMNALDVTLFFEALTNQEFLSQESQEKMSSWFDLPTEWTFDDGTLSQFQNGFGLEAYDTPYGRAIGHTGGIDGFLSIALHFPQRKTSLTLLVNSAGHTRGNESMSEIIREALQLIHE